MAQLRPVDLEGRVALVTGGTGRIGAAIADLLGSAGAEVAIADEPGEALERMAIRFGAATFEWSLSDAAGPAAVLAAVSERFGRLDVLVCAHESAPEPRPLLELPFEDYRRTMAVNLDSIFQAVQGAGRLMVAGGQGGRIVLVGSTRALAARPGGADYDASQAALRGLIRGAAIDLAADRVTVNGVLHGPLRPAADDDDYEEPATGSDGVDGVLGEPEDVARAALWLVDPDSSYVTGSAVVVDGGRSAMLSGPDEGAP